jgi:hypothetical protein
MSERARPRPLGGFLGLVGVGHHPARSKPLAGRSSAFLGHSGKGGHRLMLARQTKTPPSVRAAAQGR